MVNGDSGGWRGTYVCETCGRVGVDDEDCDILGGHGGFGDLHWVCGISRVVQSTGYITLRSSLRGVTSIALLILSA